MAISQNPITGRTRNSVGAITFTTLQGQNIVKSKILKNGHSAMHAKYGIPYQMRAFIATCAPLKPFICRSFQLTQRYSNSFNEFVHRNFWIFTYYYSWFPEGLYNKMQFSSGSVNFNVTAHAKFFNVYSISFKFTPLIPSQLINRNFKPILILIDRNTDSFFLPVPTNEVNPENPYCFSIPVNNASRDLYCWYCFEDTISKKFTNSVYLGQITPK